MFIPLINALCDFTYLKTQNFFNVIDYHRIVIDYFTSLFVKFSRFYDVIDYMFYVIDYTVTFSKFYALVIDYQGLVIDYSVKIFKFS